MIRLVPITQRAMKAWVDDVHRHLSAPTGDLYRVALEQDGRVVAVGVAARPCRMLQDGLTVEFVRIASDAEPTVNACSRLYGALRRAGEALGYARFVTYTREDEPGTSPRAAGFEFDGFTKDEGYDRPSRRREAPENPGRRWIWPARGSGRWDGVNPGAQQ